ncbi:MAG: orotidine-5'-phosphate decarboxylase [Dehalococcoidales bacterium]|nr:orotidine-5'-phosphate decarboxylase [Dehalococcoidales bacterium]
MKFTEKLANATAKNNSLLCIGLDTDLAAMPENTGVFEFNKAIIDATADLVCAYKPNLAFYEAMGIPGLQALQKTVKYIPGDIPVIADAKRGDIGNTAKAYAKAIFEVWGFDAVTASPYLGYDSLEPFLNYQEKGTFILCRTSNAGAIDFQSLPCNVPPSPRQLFEIVADKASGWNKNGNIGLVVGATYPEELSIIRQSHPNMLLLIPGVGAQGGDLEAVIRNGKDAQRAGIIINSSRQVLYASKGKDFAAASRKVAEQTRDTINRLRNAK